MKIRMGMALIASSACFLRSRAGHGSFNSGQSAGHAASVRSRFRSHVRQRTRERHSQKSNLRRAQRPRWHSSTWQPVACEDPFVCWAGNSEQRPVSGRCPLLHSLARRRSVGRQYPQRSLPAVASAPGAQSA